MAQAVIVLRAWQTWGLVDSLRRLRWGRQSKRFEIVDLALLLLLFCLSNERSVRSFFKHMGPHADLLGAAWGRNKLPTRSGFMAMLKAVDEPLVQAIRPLFCLTSPSGFRPTAFGG
jgi:hypothetical protein